MIPAKAPIGVTYAPIFEPMMVEYVAIVELMVASFKIEAKPSDIGILLIRLSLIVDDAP